MIEIERKILGITVPLLCASIEALPFPVKKTFQGLVRVYYYDFPDGSIRARKDLLRVREFIPEKEDAYIEIVYKTYSEIKDGSKIFDECEIGLFQEGTHFTGKNVSTTWCTLLEKLGLSRVVYYEKRRTHYDCGNFKCEIDEHPKIPPFLEIEAQSSHEIDKAIRLLGLEKFEQTPETIGELLERKYKPLTLNDLLF